MKDGQRVIPNDEGKDDMITQKIKRWLSKLFAWWPWRRPLETSYAQAVSNMNPGVTQESIVRNTVDGPLPQSGSRSVAVEQGRDEDIPESSRPTTEERPEYVVSTHPPLTDEPPPALHPPAREKNRPILEASAPSPTPEQKLEFLQYLVKRGIINEGFGEGQLPRQYKKSQK
ncbi:MAG: hypothetical protein JO011_22075 [Ktedonobacteraceae bacterium]|nr:hypothetical protein [Ktedonobacteraceae bacterium]